MQWLNISHLEKHEFFVQKPNMCMSTSLTLGPMASIQFLDLCAELQFT